MRKSKEPGETMPFKILKKIKKEEPTKIKFTADTKQAQEEMKANKNQFTTIQWNARGFGIDKITALKQQIEEAQKLRGENHLIIIAM